jgi:hypothetical protein
LNDNDSITVTLKDYARANLGGVNNAIAGANRDFITTLKQSNFARSLGWKFSSSSSNLGGTLTVSNYYACAGSTVCAPDLSGVNTGGLGAFLEVNYNRAGTDPSRSTLHWIQRIIVDEPGTLYDEDKIDLPPGNDGSKPYYDFGGAATPGGFFKDRPYRVLLQEGLYALTFQLYLVQETGPKQVKVYNGIRWAFRASVDQAPFDNDPPGGDPPGGSGGRGYSNAVSFLDSPSLDLKLVPEPSLSMLGLIALGIWGIVKGLKNRITK